MSQQIVVVQPGFVAQVVSGSLLDSGMLAEVHAKPIPPTCRTTNWRSSRVPCHAIAPGEQTYSSAANALEQRGALDIWFDPTMAWSAAPTGRRRRQPVFTDAAIRFCLTLRVLLRLLLRQTCGMVKSLLRLAGFERPMPDYSPRCRRQRSLTAAIPSSKSAGPLHLLVAIEAGTRHRFGCGAGGSGFLEMLRGAPANVGPRVGDNGALVPSTA